MTRMPFTENEVLTHAIHQTLREGVCRLRKGIGMNQSYRASMNKVRYNLQLSAEGKLEREVTKRRYPDRSRLWHVYFQMSNTVL